MFKLMDKKIITILRKLFLLNWLYAYADKHLLNAHVELRSEIPNCLEKILLYTGESCQDYSCMLDN